MGRANEAQLMEERAQTILTLAAGARQNPLALNDESATSAEEEPVLNAYAGINKQNEQRGVRKKPSKESPLSDPHVITSVLEIADNRRQQEPFVLIKQIVVAYGDPQATGRQASVRKKHMQAISIAGTK